MATAYEYKTGQFVSYPLSSFASEGVDSYANQVIEEFGYDDPSLPGKLHNLIFRIRTGDRRAYSWNPDSIEPFINIDLGPSLQNPADVTETRTDTVLPDDLLTPTFTQTALSDSGTGTGNQGGFNIGRHIRFYGGTSNTNRIVEWEFDNDVIDNITFSAIRGTDFNGGEDPDTTDESLYLDYYDGSSWVRIDTVVAYNDTNFNTLNSVAIAIPLAARAAGTRYRLIQPAQSGGYFDNYGITSISYSYSYTYNPLVIIDHGSVLDQEAYTLEDWGRIIYEDTNFPFGELRPVSNTTWTVVHAWVGSGTVFERGDTYYRLVAPYIVSGTLEVSGSAITHWVPSIEATGLFGIQSLTNVAFSKKESGSGNLFNIGNGFSLRSRAYLGEGTLKLESNTAVAFQPNWVGEGTIAIDGAVQDVKRTFGFYGSGTLPALNGQVERRTYSYNTSAVVPFNYLDFGTIPLQTYQHITSNQTLSGVSTGSVVLVDPGVTATVDPQYQVALPLGTPQNTIEYSPITIGKTTNEDWGFINITGTKYPFGVTRLKSETLINFVPNYVTQGDIYITGDARARTNPIWFSFIQIEVSGAAITNFSLLHPGSGNLFSIGGGETVRSRSYVGSGTLFNFVSSEEKIATDYIGGGGIKFSGDTRVSFAPNWFGEGTVKVDGTPTKLLRTFAQNEVGNLFTMSGDGYHERRTYDYNDSSIVFFDYENFGFIPSTASIQSITSSQILSGVSTDPVVRIENGVTAVVDPQFQCIINANTVPTRLFDHGTITEGYSGNIDYGFINQTVTNYPFGKFLLVSDTVTNFSLGHFTSGGITLDGTARARVNPQWFAEIQIEVNGGEQYSLTKTHVGIGTLFNFVSTTDRRAFAYEGEGQIFAISGAAESVTFNKDEQQMLFSIGGVSTNSFTPNWNGTARAEIFGTAEPVLRTFGYQTEGTLFAISGLVERRTYHYNLSSINYHQYRDYAGLPASGSITTITTSQDLSGSAPTSIIQIGVPGAGVVGTIPDGDTFTIDPTIGSIVNTFIDCGLITSPNNERTVREDYGFTSVPSSIRTKVTEYPFGHLARFVSSTTTPFSIANYVGGEFRIFGEGLDKVTPKHTSEGTLFALSGAAEAVGFNPPDITTDLKFVGAAVERVTSSEESRGGVISITGQAQEAAATAALRQVLSRITGTAGESFTPHITGFGNLFTIGQSAEAITIDIPAFQADLVFKGAATIRSTIAESFTTNIKVGGAVFPNFSLAHYGAGLIDITSEDNIPLITLSHQGEGRIFALSGAAESATFNPEEKTALFSFRGAATQRATFAESGLASLELSGSTAPEILTFSEQPFGTTSLFGAADVVNVDVYLAEGTLFAIGQSSEAITIRIPAFQADIELKGAGTQSRVFGGNIGFRHLRLSGSTEPEILTFAEQPTVHTEIFGVADTSRARAWNAEGSIFSVGFTNEAISRKLPAFQADIAFRPEKAFIAAGYREISQGGTFTISGEVSTPILTFAEQPTVFVDITGVGGTTRSRAYEANIFIGHFGGAAESITLKLPEFQSDIVFRPTAAGIKSTANWVGSGFFSLSGEVFSRYTPNYIGSGTVKLESLTDTSLTKDYVGEGRIFSIGGAAESITYNPEERQALFSFTGTKVEAVTFNPPEQGALIDVFGAGKEVFTPNYITEGTITIDITSVYARIVRFIGEGQIFSIGGAAESVTFNPDEQQALFDITGQSVQKVTRSEVVSGTLFGFGGAAESRTVAPEAKGLFTVAGFAAERTTAVEVGGGTLFNFVSSELRRTFAWEANVQLEVSGIADVTRTRDFTGFGSLFALGGAAVVTTFAADVQADIFVFGAADTPRTRVHRGSGSLFAFDSAAESRTITYENVAIFDFLGVARQRFARTVVADVNIEIRGSAAEAFVRDTYKGSASAQFFGQSEERFARTVTTSGTAKLSNEDTVPRIVRSAVVFGRATIFGDARLTRTRGYEGHCPIEIDINTKIVAPFQRFVSEGGVILTLGEARTKRIQVAPPRSYGWII